MGSEPQERDDHTDEVDEIPLEMKRAAVEQPTAEPAAEASRQPTPSGVPMTCPADFQYQFQVLRNLSTKYGEALPPDLQVPPHVWHAVRERFELYETRYAPLRKQWFPLVAIVKEEKWRRGDYEHYVNPDTIADPEAREVERKRLAEARKARHRDENISIRGAGRNLYFFRIRPDDSSQLAAVWALFENEWKDLVGSCHILVSPYLTSGKVK